jgi:2-iminoacetate synthase
MYNAASMSAGEFICHEEILAAIDWVQENKNNENLIRQLLQKASENKGLNHREAALVLEAGSKEEIFRLARQIKEAFYGNRIVLFAPLYLSNYCVNGCLYCPYHSQGKMMARKKLSQDEIRREAIALQDMGHKRLAIESGEDPVNNPIEYIVESMKTIYSIKHKNGAIRRMNVNIAATTADDYKQLKDAGIGT